MLQVLLAKQSMAKLLRRHHQRLDRIPQIPRGQISIPPPRAPMKRRPGTMDLSQVRNRRAPTRTGLRQ